MTTAISPTLLTYCFVQEAFEFSHDILSSLTPLFEPIAHQRVGQKFIPDHFVNDVRAYYGIDIPELVVDEFGNRLYQKGLLEILSPDQYAPAFKYLDDYSEFFPKHDPDVLQGIESEIDEIQQHVSQYVRGKISNFEDDATIEKALYEVIVHQSFSEFFDHSDSVVVGTAESKFQEVKKLVAISVASYLNNLDERSPERADTVLRIFEGALLSQVVLTIRTPPSAGLKAHGLTVMLDTQLVIRHLGFDGERKKKSADEFVKSIHAIGAKCGMYREHCNELHGLLTAIVKGAERGELDDDKPLGLFISRSPFLMAKASEFLRRSDGFLKENNIYITDVMGDYPNIVKNVPMRWQNELRDIIRPGGKVENRDADAAAICHTIRLTRNRRAQEALKANYLFVSNDQPLVRLADREIRTSGFLTSGEISYLATDAQLSTLLWIAVGSSNFSLPRMTLLANCSSALTPSADLLKKVRSLLKNASEEEREELEAMFTDKRCAYYLTAATGNNYKFATEDNYQDILDGMRRQTAADLAEENKKAMEEQEQNSLKVIAKIEERAGAEAIKRQAAEAEAVKQMQMRRDQEQAQRQKDERIVENMIEYRKRIELRTSALVGGVISVVGFTLAYYLSTLTDSFWWWLLLVPALLIPVLTFGMLGDWFINRYIREHADRAYLERCKELGVLEIASKRIQQR